MMKRKHRAGPAAAKRGADTSAPLGGSRGDLTARERLTALLESVANREGIKTTPIPGVTVARRSEPLRRSPVIYEPMILFLGRGKKQAYLGDEVLHYDQDNYLALSVPVPVECEFDASPDAPLLALKVTVEPAMLAEILVELDEPIVLNGAMPRGIYASPMQSGIRDAVVRLLECLQSPRDSKVLGRHVVREIVYRVLQDEPGHALRALAARSDQFMRIARVLQHVHAECARPLGSEDLAKLAGMGVSTFHHNFKAVTATSPLQYVKSVRLLRARMMMVHGGHNASTAAAAVGYESASQFGREFKRFFGATPATEAAALQARIAGGLDEPVAR